MSRLPEIVLAAFERAGKHAPEPERVDRIGYSAEESHVIEAEVERRRGPEDSQ